MVVWELVTVIGNILLFYIFFQVFSFSQLKLKRDNISFLCENFAALRDFLSVLDACGQIFFIVGT
jgi:hypothetical protein